MIDATTFERLAAARREVMELQRELQDTNRRMVFKANQSYYDGVWSGVVAGAFFATLLAVFIHVL